VYAERNLHSPGIKMTFNFFAFEARVAKYAVFEARFSLYDSAELNNGLSLILQVS
jgi:hypothetical protein